MISDLIKSMRKNKNISQAQLGDAIGCSAGNVGDWEKGRSKPGYDALISLCEFFQVGADVFLFGLDPDATPFAQLTSVEQKMLQKFRKLPEHARIDIVDNIEIKYNRVMAEISDAGKSLISENGKKNTKNSAETA